MMSECDAVAAPVLDYSVNSAVRLYEDHRGPWKWCARRRGSGAGPPPAA